MLGPTQIGSDASNYLAAGLRLDAGHVLYALVAGDRPVPLVPPFWSYPLMSPPPIAVLWRALALLPADPVMLLWWGGGIAATVAGLAYLVRRTSVAGLVIATLLAPAIVLTAISGNAAAYQAPGLLVIGVAHRHPRAAGIAVAVAAAVKLAPALLVVYLLGQGAFRAVRWTIAAGSAVALLSLLGAGVANHVAYIEVLLTVAAESASPHHPLQGLLTSALAEVAVIAAGGALALRLRRWPRASLLATAAAMTVATPTFYFQTLALLLVAAAPIDSSATASTLARSPDPVDILMPPSGQPPAPARG